MKKIIYLLILSLLLISCTESLDYEVIEESLVGNWSHMSYNDTIITLERVNNLPDDEYGISFLDAGELLEWKNAGFCGTPPISYTEEEGRWEFIADSVLELHTTFWGGSIDMEWRILELSSNQMKYYVQKQVDLLID
mgnify:CR=1 FL=1